MFFVTENVVINSPRFTMLPPQIHHKFTTTLHHENHKTPS